MAVRPTRRLMPLAPRLPRLPHEAGEHDDFARELASASASARAPGRYAWLGVLCLVLVTVALTVVCVQLTRWAPVPTEHVLPPKR